MNKTLVIAEAGVNHNGSLALAKELIDAAAAAGADYVKFQTFVAKSMITGSAPKARYQEERAGGAPESQLEMVQRLEIRYADHAELLEHAQAHGIGFASTAFDGASVDFLHTLGVDFFKVPSGEVTNLPLLRKIGATGLPILLSTGMCTMPEVAEALSILRASSSSDAPIRVLHCNTQYPTPMEDVNLLAMGAMAEALGVPVGYSDHTLGIEVPIAAVALGATVIEKHFTLDRTMPGPDHAASLEPGELTAMVRGIRNIERALGRAEKFPSPSEEANRAVVRRSLVASRAISQGDVFTEDNLTTKRPGTGVSPMHWDEALGSRASRDYCVDEFIESADVFGESGPL